MYNITLYCSWQVSESLVQQEGDFLIRDSLTSVGDYVLTCRWNQKALHFLISKVLLRSYDTYTQVQYILEDETFYSVPALVHSYVGNKRPLTKQSAAYIYSPVNRTLPLRYLETMFGLPSVENSPVNSPSRQNGSKMRESVAVTEALEIELIRPQTWVYMREFVHKIINYWNWRWCVYFLALKGFFSALNYSLFNISLFLFIRYDA